MAVKTAKWPLKRHMSAHYKISTPFS